MNVPIFIRSFFLILIIIGTKNLSAQIDFIIVNNINFIGNKKTNDRVIKYEMAIEKGDTISLDALNEIIILEEKRILNTRLFTFVKINIKDKFYDAQIYMPHKNLIAEEPWNFDYWYENNIRI